MSLSPWLTLSLLLATGAAGAPLGIANPGFEALYLGSNLPAQYMGDVPTGAFPTGPPPASWTAWYENGSPFAGAFLGVLNPGTTADHAPDPPCFPAGAPEADNVALLYMNGDAGGDEYGIEQQLSDVVTAHTTYTLTVEVGNIASCAGLVAPYTSFFDLDGFPGYRVQLLAGGVLLAEDTATLLPGEGIFELATVQHTTGASPPQEGQALTIRLVTRNEPDLPGVSGLEVDFDDVRLDASPAGGSVPLAPFGVWPVAALILACAAAALRRRGSVLPARRAD